MLGNHIKNAYNLHYYLSTDKSIITYKSIIMKKEHFFQVYFLLGIFYLGASLTLFLAIVLDMFDAIDLNQFVTSLFGICSYLFLMTGIIFLNKAEKIHNELD